MRRIITEAEMAGKTVEGVANLGVAVCVLLSENTCVVYMSNNKEAILVPSQLNVPQKVALGIVTNEEAMELHAKHQAALQLIALDFPELIAPSTPVVSE